MELNDVKDRIQKLLRLSKSPNEYEAAQALQFANKLMEAYKLSESECRSYEQIHVKGTKRKSAWRDIIASHVCWLYSCMLIHAYCDGEKIFIGEYLDAFLAGEMYKYLCKSVERIAKAAIRKNAKSRYRDSFKCGAAANICCRIRKLGKNCSWAPEREQNILLARKYAESILPLKEHENKLPKMNSKAYSQGSDKGKSISLNRQTTASAGRFISGW